MNPQNSYSRYRCLFKTIATLTDEEKQAMCAIYLKHYDAATEQQILDDIHQKSEVQFLYYADKLVGFTTLLLYQYHWQNQPCQIVFSGDTIVDRAHWGQLSLYHAWIRRVGQIKRKHSEMPLLWFLIVKGHRTYRLMPTFSNAFHPHWAVMRPDLNSLADALAHDMFGSNYNAGTGVISFPESRGQLKTEYAHPTSNELSKLAVRFFLESNPGYLQGNELVCLLELSAENLKPVARRLFLSEATDE